MSTIFTNEKDYRRHLGSVGLTEKARSRLSEALNSGAGIMTTDVISISSEEILNLHITPKLIVREPPVGKFIVPIDLFWKFTYGGIEYEAIDSELGYTQNFYLGTDSNGTEFNFGSGTGYTVGGDESYQKYFSYTVDAPGVVPTIGQPIVFAITNGVQNGNGSVKLRVRYRVVEPLD